MRPTFALLAALSLAPAARADGIGSMDQVSAAVRGCWQAPSAPAGSFVTLTFAFRRDGALLGPPAVAGIHLPGVDARTRRDFVGAAVGALEHCAPLHFTPSFGSSVAGSVFTMRFPGASRR